MADVDEGLERNRAEREAQWKERELALRERQAAASKWTTPIVTAVAAGLVGLLGTLWNGYQNLNIERKKQEGTLILEAIKTGTGQRHLAAANLLFLDGAGLITLTADQRTRLQREAGTEQPVPSLPTTLDRVTFEPSPDVTPDLESSVTRAIEAYQKFLTGLGYKPQGRPIAFSIDPSLDNMYVDGGRLVAGPRFARDTDAVLAQFTVYVLRSMVGEAVINKPELSGLAIGLPDYLVASYSGDPSIGEDVARTTEAPGGTKPYLRHLENRLMFSAVTRDADPFAIGETWGGALWDLRQRLGPQTTDRLAFTAWTRVRADRTVDVLGRFFVDVLLDVDRELNGGRNREAIRQVFTARGFTF